MSETLALCRQALHDSNHPLYSAAWLIFGEKMKVSVADQMLADRKEQVIPFLLDVVDTEELHQDNSLGSGWAPIHAVDLLGHWQVVEAVPRLLAILKDTDWETLIHDRAIVALEAMGPAVTDTLLSAAEQTTDKELRRTYASILSTVGKGDPRAFEYVKAVFDRQKDELDVQFAAEMLLACDTSAGIAVLEDRLRERRYSKRLRNILEKYIQDARKEISGGDA
jgi:hypothetical protein